MVQTLVLDFLQQIVLEEGLDPRVLERLVVRVLIPQSPHVFIGQEAGREVLGAKIRSGFLGSRVRFGCRRCGIMCDLLPLVLGRAGSGTAFSIHYERSEELGRVVEL